MGAGAPERGHLVDLVEHAVQALEDENEGGAHRLRRPIGDGQHLGDVAAEPAALHGQGVVRRQLQQGVGDLRQPARRRGVTHTTTNIHKHTDTLAIRKKMLN